MTSPEELKDVLRDVLTWSGKPRLMSSMHRKRFFFVSTLHRQRDRRRAEVASTVDRRQRHTPESLLHRPGGILTRDPQPPGDTIDSGLGVLRYEPDGRGKPLGLNEGGPAVVIPSRDAGG